MYDNSTIQGRALRGDKMVALRLADVARDDSTQIVPTIPTVASATELSERLVQRIMKAFRKAGLLVLVRPGGGVASLRNIASI